MTKATILAARLVYKELGRGDGSRLAVDLA